MTVSTPLFALNPSLDAADLAARFAEQKRLQIRDLLTQQSAEQLTRTLMERAPWGLSWQAKDDGPHKLRKEDVARLGQQEMQTIFGKLNQAMREGHFAFVYGQYQMYDALKDGWSGGSPLDDVVRAMNAPPFLDLIREVTGLPQITWCDAQATHFGPGQFLSFHQDINEAQDWLVAYVLNLCPGIWRPDWGGYLNFFDKEGDIVAGYRPRFNALNIFRVPQDHHVSYVPNFATPNRLAITGWFRGPATA